MVNKSRRRSALFVLWLQARPFSGLFGKVDPTPIKLTRLLARLASALFLYLYKVRSTTTWILALSGLSAMYNMDTLTVGALFLHLLSCGSPLWSWGNVFWGVSTWGTNLSKLLVHLYDKVTVTTIWQRNCLALNCCSLFLGFAWSSGKNYWLHSNLITVFLCSEGESIEIRPSTNFLLEILLETPRILDWRQSSQQCTDPILFHREWTLPVPCISYILWEGERQIIVNTGSILICPLRSHALVCTKNYLFIVGIWPICDKELIFIFYMLLLFLRSI